MNRVLNSTRLENKKNPKKVLFQWMSFVTNHLIHTGAKSVTN